MTCFRLPRRWDDDSFSTVPANPRQVNWPNLSNDCSSHWTTMTSACLMITHHTLLLPASSLVLCCVGRLIYRRWTTLEWRCDTEGATSVVIPDGDTAAHWPSATAVLLGTHRRAEEGKGKGEGDRRG